MNPYEGSAYCRSAAFLVDHIELTFAFPIAVAFLLRLMTMAKMINLSMKELIYLSGSIGLSIGYSYALYGCTAGRPLLEIALLAPQAWILLGMAALFIGARLRSKVPNNVSLWWLGTVVVVGHAWTKLYFYALVSNVR